MKLAEIFGDGMVLQRGSNTQVFGEGDGCGYIEFLDNRIDFKAEDGRFSVVLPELNAGEEFDMTVSLEGETKVIRNVLVGDVYLAAGQSNMELTLKDSEKIDICDLPLVRQFRVPPVIPSETYLSGWQCACGDMSELSTVGYYFSKRLHRETNVPIGIICCNQGASRIQAWVSKEVSQNPVFKKSLELHNEIDELYKFNLNNFLYYNSLMKIVPYTIKGVLWYQGESNAIKGEAENYCGMFSALVEHWRKLWDNDLPFYTVQLMPYMQDPWHSDWAMVRKQQEKASKTISHVYMITLFDTGESTEIHPRKKDCVGTALANAVLNTQFNRKEIEYSGPVLVEWKKTGNTAELVFDHADGMWLDCDWFIDTYIYDSDGIHYQINGRTATGTIEENRLCISWLDGINPVGVKMGYWSAPIHKLKNNSGYLASPFDVRFPIDDLNIRSSY